MEEHRVKFLKSIALFSSLSERELKQVSSTVSVKKFKKNETIIREEESNMFMYIILSGKVKVIRTTLEGKETILAVRQRGDFFGEMTLLDGKTVPASVISTEDAQVILISKERFFSLLYGNEKMMGGLLKILCSRLRESWDLINILSFNNASHRIRILLLLLADKYGEKVNGGTALSIKLTHQDMANMTGITRETVTRVIDKLQKSGDITVKDKYVHLSENFLKQDVVT